MELASKISSCCTHFCFFYFNSLFFSFLVQSTKMKLRITFKFKLICDKKKYTFSTIIVALNLIGVGIIFVTLIVTVKPYQNQLKILVIPCTEKTILLSPFTVNGIRSWWQFSFRFWTKWNFHLLLKPSPRSYPIHCENKWKYSFISV